LSLKQSIKAKFIFFGFAIWQNANAYIIANGLSISQKFENELNDPLLVSNP